MSTFPRPTRISAALIAELLDIARLTPDGSLTELTQAHRDDGFLGGEATNPDEFNYIYRAAYEWLRRLQTTLQGEHREATITVGGTVDTGDVRRFEVTSPQAFTVDYTTDSGDATNTDIATGWAAAINDDATAQKYVFAESSGAVVTVHWLLPLEAVSWTTSIVTDLGTADATAALVETTAGDLFIRQSDDDYASGLVIGSGSDEDTGTGAGDARLVFSPGEGGAFRAGEVAGTEWDAVNRGDHSAAFGEGCTASGDWSLAFGEACTASGDNSMAGGDTCTASGLQSIALGNVCSATQSNAVAIGTSAEATGVASLALLAGHASGAGSIAIGSASGGGQETEASGTAAVSIGRGCVASGNGAVAIGDESTAIGVDAVAMGDSASATATEAVAVGKYASASAAGSLAVGRRAIADTGSSTAVGAGADTTAGDGAIAISAQGAGAIAGGAEATGDGSICVGAPTTGAAADEPSASGADAIVVGRGSQADADNATAIGEYARADHSGKFAWSAQPIKTTPISLTTDRGSAQAGFITATSQTTDGSTVVLGGGTTTVPIRDGQAISCKGMVMAYNGSAAKHHVWDIEFIADRAGATVTLATNPAPVLRGDALVGSTALAAAAAVSSDGVKLDVTGNVGNNINWSCNLQFVELIKP